MKYIKMLGLLAVAAGALMAFAGSASATVVTSEGKLYTEKILATAGETTLHGVATITCDKSTVEGTVETHSSTTTAHGPITHLKFEECTGGNHVTVLKPGRLIVHTDGATADGNGTLTSVGAEVTIQITGLGISCIFGTSEETHIGTVKGGKNASMAIDATIKRLPGDDGIFCGSSGTWTGTYTVQTPTNLTID